MAFEIKWHTVPKIEIDCSQLQDPHDIASIFKQHGIDWYVYRIKYKDIVIKYGMSAAESEYRDWGERLYRQIAHTCSWGDKMIRGSSGAEWVYIEEDFKNSYNHELDHRHLTVTVYNFTNYKFDSFKPQNEIYYAEQELIYKYKQVVGNKPIGNRNDATDFTRFKQKGFVSKKLFDEQFIEY